jgi:hypothetical protein
MDDRIPPKNPISLTPTQVDLVGAALTEHTWQLASRISHAGHTEPTPEEVLLLKAYIEVAKVFIAPNIAPGGESGTRTAWAALQRNPVALPNPVPNPRL